MSDEPIAYEPMSTQIEFPGPDSTTIQFPTEAPVTITFDVAALAKHLVPDYDAPYSEDGPPPMGALDGILKHVADRLVANIDKGYVQDAVEAAQTDVRNRVQAIVEDVLAEGAVVGDGYTTRKTKPLREMIRDEVQNWVTKPISNSSGGRSSQTALQQMVALEVTRALKEDLTAVLTEERDRFREAIRTLAAATLADDATRRR